MSQFERLQKAAALKYSDNGTDSAPVVVASGSGHIAQTIIDIAEKNGVPVFRDSSLATLLSQLQCDTEIPPELYRAVVDIYVYFLGFRVDQNGKVVRGSPAEKPPEEGSTKVNENPINLPENAKEIRP
ncbi:MAG: FlhB HrpN YscU SpaS Family protein [Thermocaproicibacter melissae]|jgi:flagellar biosynthesis protein|uniref:EscU/YscU/HrcU family type III secretion system export apparatus switch protein n=1 Tax=Thermocaproicibacter melissae TaxID=2966552 RepID=UPI003A100235